MPCSSNRSNRSNHNTNRSSSRHLKSKSQNPRTVENPQTVELCSNRRRNPRRDGRDTTLVVLRGVVPCNSNPTLNVILTCNSNPTGNV